MASWDLSFRRSFEVSRVVSRVRGKRAKISLCSACSSSWKFLGKQNCRDMSVLIAKYQRQLLVSCRSKATSRKDFIVDSGLDLGRQSWECGYRPKHNGCTLHWFQPIKLILECARLRRRFYTQSSPSCKRRVSRFLSLTNSPPLSLCRIHLSTSITIQKFWETIDI